MDQKNNNLCIGLFGSLFGHKYRTVYSRKPNYPTAAEAEELLSSSMRRRPGFLTEYFIKDIVNGRGKELILAEYEICRRCGHKIIPLTN